MTGHKRSVARKMLPFDDVIMIYASTGFSVPNGTSFMQNETIPKFSLIYLFQYGIVC